MRNILVTGGTGFIGNHLVEELVKNGYHVKCLVRAKSNVIHLKRLNVELFYSELNNKEALEKATEGVDTVFHLAAIRGEKKIPKKEYFEVNVLGTKNLLNASIKNKVKKFIYCSSVGVTGWPKKLPINENFSYKPKGIYHISKVLAEKEVLKRKNEINVVIVRPVIAYGTDDFDGFLLKLYNLFKSKSIIKRIGNGDNYIHLVSIENLVDGILKAGEKGKNGEVYIIADANPIKIKDLNRIICKALNKKVPKIFAPIFILRFFSIFLKSLKPKIDIMTKNRYYDISKAKKEMGYKPKESNIENVIRSYSK